MELTNKDFNELSKCPWCNDNVENSKLLYTDLIGCDVVQCSKCGLVYAKRRLNGAGLDKYWNKYYSRVHTADQEMNYKREKMYELDFKYINSYISNGSVLDIGCGDGSFMNYFERNGFKTVGVEFGKEAASVGKKEHNIYYGVFTEIDIDEAIDLVVFRGVLQYVPDSKAYLEKAISLLKNRGIIFITAQPNIDSFCFNLFKENFTQPISGTDFCGFSESILTEFMVENGMRKIGEKYFYEETPYANVKEDIKAVAKAISCNENGENIAFSSPPFWGNMMSLVYEKI